MRLVQLPQVERDRAELFWGVWQALRNSRINSVSRPSSWDAGQPEDLVLAFRSNAADHSIDQLQFGPQLDFFHVTRLV